MESIAENNWQIADARDLYGIDRWGVGYFDIDGQGRVTVAPLKEKGPAIPVLSVIDEAVEQGLHFPMLIRFQDLLRHRVMRINQAFALAMEEFGYHSCYRGVYPVKVNQLREVVEEVIDAGRPFHYGLEVGSKPELFAALAVHDDPESLIICNGYKDRRYIQGALVGRKMAKKVILVIEKIQEIEVIIDLAREMGVTPWLGVRVRLAARGSGQWQKSSGDEAKFGLSTGEILQVSTALRKAGLGDSLKLVHFHIGSQIPDIMAIKLAVREGAMYYAKLAAMGHGLEYLDVGGGLGVDYDGSRTTFHSSANYSLNEYARDIVYNIKDVCDAEQVAHPVIVSESGRAVVAHHSLLVIQAHSQLQQQLPVSPALEAPPDPRAHKLVREGWALYNDWNAENPLEFYHDALHLRQEAQNYFALGLLDLPAKAAIEAYYWQICRRTLHAFADAEYIPDEVEELKRRSSGQYLCNFSVFQSMLDHWGLGQLFPIMPLHRLDEEPRVPGTLVDITCDSDGQVAKFIDLQGDHAETLPLHVMDDRPYYLGVFLTGAYQDIMGDLHNLFGRVNEAHVFLDEDEEAGYYIEEIIQGTTMEKVLSLVQYGDQDLLRRMKRQIDRAIKGDRLRPNEGMKLLQLYDRSLKGYTYLEL